MANEKEKEGRPPSGELERVQQQQQQQQHLHSRPRSISTFLSTPKLIVCKAFAAHSGKYFTINIKEDEPLSFLKEKIASFLGEEASSLILLLPDGNKVNEIQRVGECLQIVKSSNTPSITPPTTTNNNNNNNNNNKNIIDNNNHRPDAQLLSSLLSQSVSVFVLSSNVVGPSPLPSLPIPPIFEAEILSEDSYECAKARCIAIKCRYETCCWALFEFTKEVEAMGVMNKNITIYKDAFCEDKKKARERYEKEKDNDKKFLSSFDNDIVLLKKSELHPSLALYPSDKQQQQLPQQQQQQPQQQQQQKRGYLVDLLPSKDYLSWRDSAQRKSSKWQRCLEISFEKLEKIISEIDYFQKEVVEMTEKMNQKGEGEDQVAVGEQRGELRESKGGELGYVTRGSLVRKLGRHAVLLEESREKMKEFEREAVYEKQKDLCVHISELDYQSKALTSAFYQGKQNAEEILRGFIMRASRFQKDLTKNYRERKVIEDARSRVEETFFSIKCIHNLPAAHDSAVQEIHRRVAWKDYFSVHLQATEKLLFQLLNEEFSSRKIFDEKSGSYLLHLRPVFSSPLPPFKLTKYLDQIDPLISRSSLSPMILDKMIRKYPPPKLDFSRLQDSEKLEEERKKWKKEKAKKNEELKKKEEELQEKTLKLKEQADGLERERKDVEGKKSQLEKEQSEKKGKWESQEKEFLKKKVEWENQWEEKKKKVAEEEGQWEEKKKKAAEEEGQWEEKKKEVAEEDKKIKERRKREDRDRRERISREDAEREEKIGEENKKYKNEHKQRQEKYKKEDKLREERIKKEDKVRQEKEKERQERVKREDRERVERFKKEDKEREEKIKKEDKAREEKIKKEDKAREEKIKNEEKKRRIEDAAREERLLTEDTARLKRFQDEDSERLQRIIAADNEREERIKREDRDREKLWKEREGGDANLGVILGKTRNETLRMMAFDQGLSSAPPKDGDVVVILPSNMSKEFNPFASSSSSSSSSLSLPIDAPSPIGSLLVDGGAGGEGGEEGNRGGSGVAKGPYRILVHGGLPRYLHRECYGTFKRVLEEGKVALGQFLFEEFEWAPLDCELYGVQSGVEFIKVACVPIGH